MNVKPETVDKVKLYFNLNIYETKVWLSLLQKGVASAGEIAEISGVPRSRTYDVLESLEKQGFAMQKIGKPVKYIAVRPVAVIEKLKKDALAKMNQKIDTLSNITDTKEYQELELLHSSQSKMIKKQDLSGTIKGKSNVNNQISELLSIAEKEVIICTSGQDFLKRAKFLEPVVKKLYERGVKVYLGINGEDKEINAINSKFGLKAKKTEINASFYVADKAEILFMLNNSEDEQMAVWFSSPFFVNSFTSLFEIAQKKIQAK
jgi:HTH-type transcriptional regulator, sugar sensing transcriptional regulator